MKRIFAILMAVMLLTTFCACGAENKGASVETQTATEAPVEVDLQDRYEEIVQKMPEMILLDETMMMNFCGISAADCTESYVATCADGLRTDEIWLIEAANADALASLKELAETRLRIKGEESASYSPEQYAVVQKAELITSGLYLILVVSPDVDTLAPMAAAGIQ